jgi:hypothetical protein
MHWVLVIFAVVVLAAAAGCFWWRQRVGGEIAVMAATPTSSAADIARLTPGKLAEIKGTLRCAGPLTAEFSKQACAYYKSEIRRETVYYENDSQGRRERKTRTDNVQSNTQFAPCTIEDASGRVTINLDGADIEGLQVIDRRSIEDRGLAATVISAALGGNDSSTLIHTETILPLDIPVYALGEVQTDHTIGRPLAGSKNRHFIVSHKSEEQRGKDLKSTMLWLLIGGGVLGLIGLGLAVLAVMKSTG